MISYNLGDTQFNYRVVAILLHRGRVLIHQEEGERFWTLPGGRCEILEESRETLKREMLEELGLEAEIGPLVWVAENFFRREGRDWHEIAFYYRVEVPPGEQILEKESSFSGVEEGKDLTFVWKPLDELNQIDLFPEALRGRLKDVPDTTERVVWRDAEERMVVAPETSP